MVGLDTQGALIQVTSGSHAASLEGDEMRLQRKLPKPLIEAYMNDPTFYAVVTQHEMEGSSYTAMLEHAVDELVKRDKAITSHLLEYVSRFGLLKETNEQIRKS